MSKKANILNWSILLLLALIWGTSFILIKKGLESFSSIQIASLRIFISFLFLLPVALRNIRKISRENITSLIIIGVIGSAIPAFLYPMAQTKIDSSVAGMLNSLTPVFTFLIGILLYSRKIKWRQTVGILIGLAGAVGLLYKGSFIFNSAGLLVVLATLFYGISTNQITRIKGINGIVITSLAFIIIGPVAGVNLLLSDFSPALETENFLRNLGLIAILSILSTGIAVGLFNVLILRTSPLFATSVTYLVPIVAGIWGIADGEIITPFMIISVIFILAGVYFTNIKMNGIIKKRLKRE